MTALEALKRLEQETAPNTYLDDFDKRACIDAIKKELKASNCLKHTLDNNTLYRAFTYEEASRKILREKNRRAGNVRLHQAIEIGLERKIT